MHIVFEIDERQPAGPDIAISYRSFPFFLGGGWGGEKCSCLLVQISIGIQSSAHIKEAVMTSCYLIVEFLI